MKRVRLHLPAAVQAVPPADRHRLRQHRLRRLHRRQQLLRKVPRRVWRRQRRRRQNPRKKKQRKPRRSVRGSLSRTRSRTETMKRQRNPTKAREPGSIQNRLKSQPPPPPQKRPIRRVREPAVRTLHLLIPVQQVREKQARESDNFHSEPIINHKTGLRHYFNAWGHPFIFPSKMAWNRQSFRWGLSCCRS